MRYEIIIEDVDQEARTDIEYVINRYLMKVDGLVNTGCGSGVYGGEGLNRTVYKIIPKNFRKGLLDVVEKSYN